MSRTFDLAVGDPAGSPPKRLQDALTEGISHPAANHYASPAGLAITREAVARYYRTNHGVAIDPYIVAITQGARPALYFGMRAADRPGQPVGYFAPAYTAFEPQIVNAGMRAIPIQSPDRQLSSDVLMTLLRPVTDGVFILNSPHNPTGRVFTAVEIAEFCRVAKAYNIRVISDFVYADLYEADAPISILAIEPTAIEIISISKPFRACGWRVGTVVGDAAWVGRLIERYTALNGVPFAFQHAAAVAWSEMPSVDEFRTELKHRRDILVTGLRGVGFSVDTELHNRSGMFVWAKIPDHCPTAADVQRRLAGFGVLVSDGTDFGGDGGRHLRFALNESAEVLLDAVPQISNTMETYNDHNEGALLARCAVGRGT